MCCGMLRERTQMDNSTSVLFQTRSIRLHLSEKSWMMTWQSILCTILYTYIILYHHYRMVCPTCHQPLQPSFLSMAAGLDIFGMPKRADVVLAIFSVCHLHSYSGCSRSCLTKFQSTMWYYMYTSTSTSKDLLNLLSWLYGLVYPSVIEQLELDIQASHQILNSNGWRWAAAAGTSEQGDEPPGRHPYFPLLVSPMPTFASWLLSTQTIPSYIQTSLIASKARTLGQVLSSFQLPGLDHVPSYNTWWHFLLVLIIHRDNPNKWE